MAGVKNGNGSNGGLWWKLLEDATSALLKNRRATEYLQKRGISEKTIKKYRIGLITEEMYQWIQRKDKSIRITRDFVNRIVFPVGYKLLVGRTLESEPEEKKYVNTPGFRKAETLYNLERVRGQEKVYVTEGIMDAILLTEAGYPAVAMLGSSLSEKQAELLQGFRVILTPDGDRAGKKGVRKSAEALRLAGFDLLYDVEVAVLPEKTDPAGLAAEHIDVLHRVMEDTLPCETFLCYLDRRYLEELFRKYMREGEISRAIYLFSPGVKTNRRFQRYMKLIEKLSELLEVKGGSGG
jgi:DNA primase